MNQIVNEENFHNTSENGEYTKLNNCSRILMKSTPHSSVQHQEHKCAEKDCTYGYPQYQICAKQW